MADNPNTIWTAHDYDIAYQATRRILSQIDDAEMAIDFWVNEVAGMAQRDATLTADLQAAQDSVIACIDNLMAVRDNFKRNRDFYTRLEHAETQQRPM